MNSLRSATSLVGLVVVFATAHFAQAQQRPNEVRKAQPVTDPPVARALPVDAPPASASPSPRKFPIPGQQPVPGQQQPASTPPPPAPAQQRPPVQQTAPPAQPQQQPTARPPAPAATATPRPSIPEPTVEEAPPEAPPSTETESADRRQLDYANALFGRKLYDLAIPEYEKFLGQFPGRRAARAPTSTSANATAP
jgi:hypothetical protein